MNPEEHDEETAFIFDDGNFTVWKTPYGVWRSADREGNALLTAPTKESCEDMTRWKLAGYPGGETIVTNVRVGNVDL